MGGHGQGHLLAVAGHFQDSVEFYRKAFLALELLSDKILTVQHFSGDVRRFGGAKNQGLTEIKTRHAPPELAVLSSSPTSGASSQLTLLK
jgi:hypothetical protein